MTKPEPRKNAMQEILELYLKTHNSLIEHEDMDEHSEENRDAWGPKKPYINYYKELALVVNKLLDLYDVVSLGLDFDESYRKLAANVETRIQDAPDINEEQRQFIIERFLRAHGNMGRSRFETYSLRACSISAEKKKEILGRGDHVYQARDDLVHIVLRHKYR